MRVPIRRRHYPIRFSAYRAAEAYWGAVRYAVHDARLVNLRRTADGWAACLSTRFPAAAFRKLAVAERKFGGRCICSGGPRPPRAIGSRA